MKFKPIRKVNLSKVELNLEKSYEAMTGINIDQSLLSFDTKIREMEQELDLKDYYDIKRPTIVYFSKRRNKLSNKDEQGLIVSRYDILSEKMMESEIS